MHAPDQLRCPVCGDALSARPTVTCPICETPAHAECREFVGGCSRFACSEAATPRGRLSEVLSLVHTEAVVENGVLVVFLVGMMSALPSFYLAFLPVLVWRLIRFVRAVHRRRRAARAGHEQLAADFKHLLATQPLKLYQPARAPARPLFGDTLFFWYALIFGMCVAATALDVILGARFTASHVLGILSSPAWFGLCISVFTWPRQLLQWKQASLLHQAGKIFQLWREELLPSVPAREDAALLTENKLKQKRLHP